jgi:BNR/Asp-box repeat.
MKRIVLYLTVFALISVALVTVQRSAAQDKKGGIKQPEELSLIEELIEWWNGTSQQEREESEENDADLPPWLAGSISKAEYLELRSGYIARLRGVNPHKPFDLRQRGSAIKQMERQEAATPFNLSPSISTAQPVGSWTYIGPSPLPNGQTTTISTPVSGRVTSIDVHPTNSNIAYVGTAQGGVFRTTDGGGTWTPLMDNALSLAIGWVAIAPSQPSTVYVGTGEGNGSADSFFGVGIYRIDNADTSPTLSGPFNRDGSNNDVFTNNAVTKLIVHPTDPNTIFVSTHNGVGGIGGVLNSPQPSRGLYRSTNAAGATPTFTKMSVATANGGDRRVNDVIFEPGNPNNVLAWVGGFSGAGDGGLWLSTNALAATPAFTRILAAASASSIIRANLAAVKVGSTVTVLVADGANAAHNAAGSGTLFKATGNDFGTLGAFSQMAAANGFCGGQCFYDEFVVMDPANANMIYLGGSADGTSSKIFQRSTNGGASFSSIDTGLHADSHAFTLAPSNNARGYFGSDGGIWRADNVTAASANAVAWTSLNNTTFSATQFQSIAVHPTDTKFTIGGTQDNGTELSDTAGTWRRADFGDGGFSLIDQNAADTSNVTMYHTYFNQTNNLVGYARVDTSAGAVDNGWGFFGCNGVSANGINCNDTAVNFYAPLARGPGNPNTVYYGSDRLYRSSNKGVNNTVVSQAPLVSGVAISAIGISPTDDNTRIVGLDNGNVFATTSGSSTLTNISAGLPSGFYISRAVIDPNTPTTAYVVFADYGTGGTVWKTTNLAAPTWTNASGTGATALPNVPANAIVIDSLNSNNIYVGTDIGVYASTDGGATWAPFGTGLPRVAVFDMAIQPTSRTLRIATHGRGMWETALSFVTAAAAKVGGRVLTSAGKGIHKAVVTVTTLQENRDLHVQAVPELIRSTALQLGKLTYLLSQLRVINLNQR